MKPPSIVIDHFLSTKWSKKLFTINHYELQNGKCIVTQELSAYFNFTPVIKNFLSENKKIYCENCMHEFSEEEYNLMKKYGGTCLKCGCKNSIQEKRVLSDEERSEIEEIEKK